jgi:hypothetical protein
LNSFTHPTIVVDMENTAAQIIGLTNFFNRSKNGQHKTLSPSTFIFRRLAMLSVVLLTAVSAMAQTTRTFSTAGVNHWICPPGVTTVTVECWGGGGAGGGNAFVENGGGGGAGGAYVKTTGLAVTANTNYTVLVGAGGVVSVTFGDGGDGADSWFNNSATVKAAGGPGGTRVTGIGGGNNGTGPNAQNASASTGGTKFTGGNGGDGNTSGSGRGGGGGSSGGTAANGGNGGNATGGGSPTQGSGGTKAGAGSGGDGGGANADGLAGSQPGGGGGGSGDTNRLGGAGGDGRVTIAYTDATAPTVTINQAGGQADPTNTSPINFTAVFSEEIDPATFTSGDLITTGSTATGISVGTPTTSDNVTWNIPVTVTGPGTVILAMNASQVKDWANNNNTASTFTDKTVTFDNVAPTVTLNQGGAQLDPTNGAITFTAVFSKAINPATFIAADVTNTGTAPGAVVQTPTTGDNITWTVTVNGMTGNGTVILSLAAGVVADPAGNLNTASTFTDRTVTFDNTAPTVTLNQAGAQVDPTNGATINFTAVFSEAINPGSFVAGDVTNTGTAPGAVIGAPTTLDNITWTIPVTGMSANGTVILAMAAGVVADPAGNTNTASTFTDKTVTFDNQAPTVTLNQAGSQVDPTNASPINFTAVFSEAINPASFTAADVTNSGTAPGAVIGTPSTLDNITWTIPVTGMSNDGTVILSMAAGVVSDPAGNTNTAATFTDKTVTYDQSPAVTVNQAGAQPDPTNGATINFTAVFSKAINPASFVAGDVTIAGTATGSTAGTPTTSDNITWTIPITGMSSDGTVIVSLGAGVVVDAAGFGNTASTFTDQTVTFDTTGPTVTLNQAGAQADPTNGATINFTAVFNEPINPATFTAADISLSGTATGSTVGTPTTLDNITWTVPVTGMSASGTVILTLAAATVQDPAGNNNTASTFTDNTVTFDNVAPTVTLNQGGAQVDPTNASPVIFTAVFSEPINPASFTAADITNTGTAPGAVIGTPTTADNITWSISVGSMSGSGTIILSMTANKVTDPAGNNNTAATFTDRTVTYDVTAPTVTVNQAGGQPDPTGLSPINFTAVFSEPINPATFTAADVTLSGTASGAGVNSPTTLDNITWTIPITGMSSTGTVIVSLGANKVTDVAGNNNTASTFTDQTVTYDITPPTVNSIVIGPAAPLTGIGTTNGTSASSLPFTITFSEPVTGLDATDFALSTTGSVLANFGVISGGPTTYTVNVNILSGQGTIRLDFFANGTVQDLAGNQDLISFTSGGAGATYTVVLPQPAAHVTGFNAAPGIDNYSVVLTWSTNVPSATGYAIRVQGQLDDDSNGTYIPLADGSQPAADATFTDGNGLAYVPNGTFTYTFTTLLSGKTYDFQIVPYALSPFTSADNIDYRLDGSEPTKTTTVTTGSLSAITVNVVAPTTISSLQTSYNPGAVYNMSVALRDDFVAPGASIDNARTRFTDVVVFAGAANTVPNWSDVLAEAELFDLSENPASPIITTAITANTITFSGIPTGSNAVGALDDNEAKAYRMKVRLKSTLTGGANLTTDNLQFDFMVNTSSFTYQTATSQPSRFEASQTFSSGAGRNIVSVIASGVTFNPAFGGVQPPTTASPLTNLAVTPKARAVDANGNTDRDFTTPLTATSAGGLNMWVAPGPPIPATSVILNVDAAAPNAGIYTFPANFQYADAGTGSANNGTLQLSDGVSVTGSSSNVTVTYSTTTKINVGPFVEPASFSSLFDTSIGFDVNNNRVFDFNVVDDNGAGGDGTPTRITQIVITQGPGNDVVDWTQVIADVLIYNGSATPTGVVNPTNLTFALTTALPGIAQPGDFGYIPDNGTQNYRVYIRLKPNLPAALQTTIDGLNLVFQVSQTSITLDPNSSQITPAETQNSGSTNVAIDVEATKLRYTNIIGSPTLVSKDISIQQSVPAVEAVDINGNRDLNYNSTTIAVTSGATTIANPPAANAMTAGFMVFPNNFQLTTVAINASVTVKSSTNNAIGGLGTMLSVGAVSPLFNVTAGTASLISAGAAAPATYSSITTASPGTGVFNFVVTDDPGGTPALQDDGAPTFVNVVKITQSASNTVANWTQAIAGAILSDGNPAHDMVASSINPTDIQFNNIFTASPLLSTVADNAPKTFTLKVWLKTTLGGTLPVTIDGSTLGFELLSNPVNQNIVSTAAGTGMLTVPAQQFNSLAANVVDVTATELRYIVPASFPQTASLNTDFPGGGGQITLQATDAFGNRDLGFTGASGQITTFSNHAGLTTAPTSAAVVGTQFLAGVYMLPTTFKYTTGSNGNDATLTVIAGASNITAPSPNFDIKILSSSESSLIKDPTYVFVPTLDYVNHQETSTTSSSLEVARYILLDGGRTNALFGTTLISINDTGADGIANGDKDGAVTTLTDLTLTIKNPSSIRTIALFSGTTKLSEITQANMATLVPTPVPSFDFVFPSFTLTAADDAQQPLSVRVSFRNTAPQVTDQAPIDITVFSAALASNGSSLFPTGIAGVDPLANPAQVATSPVGFNRVDVIAKDLDFTTSPPSFVGKETITTSAGVIQARDENNIVDTDLNGQVSLSAPSATINGTYFLVSGVLNLNNQLQYSSTGVGTLTATTFNPVLGLNINSLSGGATPCSLVNVIEVTTAFNGSGAPSSNTLLANSHNQVIFGFQFGAIHTVGPDHPKISSFTVSFNTPTSPTFSSVNIYESTTGNFTGATNVNSSATVTNLGSDVQVTFAPGSERSLIANPSLSYFVVVDVGVSVNGNTAPVFVSIVDGGSTTGTAGNILADVGTQSSNTQGITYAFASIAPPTLASTYPPVASTNVATDLGAISLKFSVPVFSMDDKIELWDNTVKTSPPVKITDLHVLGGIPGGVFQTPTTGNEQQPIKFKIDTVANPLLPSHDYFIKIDKGTLNASATGGTGIMDVNLNLFGGITYSGAVFFRTTDKKAPKILGTTTTPTTVTDPSISNITANSATINAIFDKTGKAYYLVLPGGSAAPTINQIFDPVANPYVGSEASGSFNITATNTVTQYGIITPTGNFVGTNHDVWIAAETFYLSADPVSGASITRRIRTTAPYGGLTSNFLPLSATPPVSTGPTLSFSTAAVTTSSSINTNLRFPTNSGLSICSNSYQLLNKPIVIYEGTGVGQQFGNGPTGGPQNFNLVLPAGFQFDVSVSGTTPLYGTVQLQGADFVGTVGTLSYPSPSIVKVTFTNRNNTSTNDKIIINGLRVLATGSQSGNIFRLGGDAMASFGDGSIVGSISATEAASLKFDNSYSSQLIPKPAVTETAIPDNFAGQVLLSPIPNNNADFGPSTFAGTGIINGNELNLKGVTNDDPFNITITHTDNNGCISQNAVQYVVYNHLFGVNIANGAAIDQGPYCSPNPNFIIDQQINFTNPTGTIRAVTYNNLPGYYLDSLTAAIPQGTPSTTIINSIGTTGAAWNTIVTGIFGNPLHAGRHDSTFIAAHGRYYYGFVFDEKSIVNAPAGGIIPYLYDDVRNKQTTDPNPFYTGAPSTVYYAPQSYYKGGSLGFVEFTGRFINASNPSVAIKRRQLIEFILPSIPAVELASQYSLLLTGSQDPYNVPGSGGPNNTGRPANQGTPVLCEQGGNILINGWPKPSDPGSKGVFKLYKVGGTPAAQTFTDITALGGFTDQTNGTASIDPLAIKGTPAGPAGGLYTDLRVEYSYHPAGFASATNPAICDQIAYLYLRVAANPVAIFTQGSDGSNTHVTTPASATPPTLGYCEGVPVKFDGTGSTVADVSGIRSYTWDFTDPTNNAAANPNKPSGGAGTPASSTNAGAGTNDIPVHIFSQSANYTPKLTVVSNFGCSSLTASTSIDVGAIPLVSFNFTGISTADNILFDGSTSQIQSTITDGFQQLAWTFGDGTATLLGTIPKPTHTYANPGVYSGTNAVNLKVTSNLGCTDNLSKPIVILRSDGASSSVTYKETFETSPLHPIGNGQWQVYNTGAGALPNGIIPAGPATWVYATSGGTLIKADANINQTGYWVTRNPGSGKYDPSEHSALYSPSFDISGLKRPMVSFNNFVQMRDGDGVVLQYSFDNKNVADPTKTWYALGNPGEGVDWFTSQGISANPGEQTANLGWGKDVTEWKEPKHTLDEIFNNNALPVGGLTHVVFRFALGSAAGGPLKEGFGLDNFRVGERTRTILLENFGNTSNSTATELAQSTAIAGFQSSPSAIGTEVVKLNYHVSFPGRDPFNEDDPADPSSRALFYNIQTTPVARMDGKDGPNAGTIPNQPFAAWSTTQYNTRTLNLAQADIVIRPTNTVASPTLPAPPLVFADFIKNGKVSFFVDIYPTVDLDAKTILQVALVEQKIPLASLPSAKQALVKSGETSFEWIVKRMLPTASGTKTATHPNAKAVDNFALKAPATTTAPATIYTFGPFDWIPDPTRLYAPNTADLAITVFLQDEDHGNVYQAELVKDLDDPSNVVTGLEPIFAEDVKVYPVPAHKEMHVVMPGRLADTAPLELIDQTGRTALQSAIPAGESRTTLNVMDLASGVYILQINVGNGNFTRKKVMVVHDGN